MVKKGQLTIDFLFAFTLVILTVLNLIYLSGMNYSHSQTLDVSARLSAFATDLQNTVARVYSSGNGYSAIVFAPLNLSGSDRIVVVLDNVTNRIVISAVIGGSNYTVIRKSPVPLYVRSEETLNATKKSLWVVARLNPLEGQLYVEVKPTP